MKSKKIISILLIVMLAATMFAGCSSKDSAKGNADESKELVMYTNAEYAPYEYFDGDKIVGVDVDIANEIAKELGKELKIEHVDFESVVPAIESGRGDFGAAGLAINEERLQSVDFSIPYVGAGHNVVFKTGADLDTVEKLAGKKIGVQLGTTCEGAMKEAIENGVLKDKGTEIMQYASPIDAAQDILSGRIDALVVNTAPAEELVKENKELTSTGIDVEVEKFAICVKKGNTELLEKINKVLERLLDEGKIDEYLKNHSK